VGHRVVLVQPHAVVDAEAGVLPAEHAVRHLGLEQFAVHEQLQHAAPERLGQHRGGVGRQVHERTVGTKAAVGDLKIRPEALQSGLP